MRTTMKIAFASLFIAALAFTACQKSGLLPNAEDTQLATDNARMDNESDNIGSVINAIAYSNGMSSIGQKTEGPGGVFGNITLPACATVTIDTISNPKSITVDFGSSPCLCDQWDNLYRQGVIKATWTGAYRDPGTVITIVTTNFYRGIATDQMDKYDVNRTVTNMGPNANGNLQFHIVTTINVSYFDGTTSNWSADKMREWIQGESTKDISDDVFVITGSVSGTNRNGIPVSATITTPLTKNACTWFVSGVVEITRGTMPTITLDYGNGNCDNLATITVNGHTKTITLN